MKAKVIKIRPGAMQDPVFGDVCGALSWRSSRHEAAEKDTALLRGSRIVSVSYTADSAEIVCQHYSEVLILSVFVEADASIAWRLRKAGSDANVTSFSQCAHGSPVILDWGDSNVTTWDRSEQLYRLVGKTMAGLSVSNSYIWVYPVVEQPLAFTVIVDCVENKPILFWQWDNY